MKIGKRKISTVTAILLGSILISSVLAVGVWVWYSKTFNAQVTFVHHDFDFYEDEALTIPWNDSTVILWKFNDGQTYGFDSEVDLWCNYTGLEEYPISMRITANGLPACIIFKTSVWQPLSENTVLDNGDNVSIIESPFRCVFNLAYDGTPQETSYPFTILFEVIEPIKDRV